MAGDGKALQGSEGGGLMHYLSICSGIEAASKRCSKCGEDKPLGDFHKQPSGKFGRHSWCRECFNANYRGARTRRVPTELKRLHNFRRRYGLTPEEVATMLDEQDGCCAICGQPPERPVVDHCHKTKKVRGILCHGCNIKLPSIEDDQFLSAALRYLRRAH